MMKLKDKQSKTETSATAGNPCRRHSPPPAIDERDYFYSVKEAKNYFGAGGAERVSVVLYLRVSTKKQRENEEARVEEVYKKCERSGIDILRNFADDKSGRSYCIHKRKGFLQAVAMAKSKGVPLLAISVDRVVRTGRYVKYHPEDNYAPLCEKDIIRLQEITGDLPIVTLIPPGTPPEEVTGFFTRLGQAGKGNNGGRPPKKPKHPAGDMKKRREEYEGKVFQLHREKNSLRDISKIIFEECSETIPKSTIGRWIKAMKNEKNP